MRITSKNLPGLAHMSRKRKAHPYRMRNENDAAQTDLAAIMTSGTYERIIGSPPLLFVLFSIADVQRSVKD